MPWLGERTPAHWLARGDIGAIEDLRLRINQRHSAKSATGPEGNPALRAALSGALVPDRR